MHLSYLNIETRLVFQSLFGINLYKTGIFHKLKNDRIKYQLTVMVIS
jgi:hypothetical protein